MINIIINSRGRPAGHHNTCPISLGNMGSAFVEVLVKSSSIENGEDYLSLLPQSMLMSAEESRSNRNLTRTKLFLTGNH